MHTTVTKPDNAAFEFIKKTLVKNPAITYAEVEAAAKARGFTIYPINFGRARAILGQIPAHKWGEKKAEVERQRVDQVALEATGDTVADGIADTIRKALGDKERLAMCIAKIEAALKELRGS